MKKAIPLVFLSFVIVANIYAQTNAVYCTGNGYRGHVFDKSYLVLKSIAGQKSKAIISCDEIKMAEAILKMNLPEINKNQVRQSEGCPDIVKRLSKYRRQYLGFINAKGETIIWINLFGDTGFDDGYGYILIDVHDGCSNFWNIEVNISNKSLSNLQINPEG